MFWLFAGEENGDGVFEIVLRGLRAIFSEGENAIVDAAAINEFAFRVKDGGFGSNGGAGDFDEFVLRVVEEICGEMIIATMRGNFRVGVGRVGINEIEGDFVGRKFMGEAFDFGREFVRDWAFGADENEDDEFGVGFQWELRGNNRQRQKYESDQAQQHADRIAQESELNMRFDLRGGHHKLVVRR